jgi:hypothetical protein
MQFAIEVTILECSFVKHSHGPLGVNQLDVWNSTRACVKNQIPASTTEGEDESHEDKGSPEL